MIPALVVIGCLVGVLVSGIFVGVVLIYLALSLTYSFYVKKVAVLDVILLAGLYTCDSWRAPSWCPPGRRIGC